MKSSYLLIVILGVSLSCCNDPNRLAADERANDTINHKILDDSAVMMEAFKSIQNIAEDDKKYLHQDPGLDYRVVAGYQEIRKLAIDALSQNIREGFYKFDPVSNQVILTLDFTGQKKLVLFEKTVVMPADLDSIQKIGRNWIFQVNRERAPR